MPVEFQLAQLRAEASRQSCYRRMRDITYSTMDTKNIAEQSKSRTPDQVVLGAFAKFRSSILASWPKDLNAYWSGLAIGEKSLAYSGWKSMHEEGRDVLLVERVGQPNIVVIGVAPTIPESCAFVKEQIASIKPATVALALTSPFLPATCPPTQTDPWQGYPHLWHWWVSDRIPAPATIDAALHTKDTNLPSSVRWGLQKIANTLATVSVAANYAWNIAEMQIAADMRTAAGSAGLTDPLSLHDEIVAAAAAINAPVLRAAAPNVVLGTRRRGLMGYLRCFDSDTAPSWRWKTPTWPFVWAHQTDPQGDEAEQAAMRAVMTDRDSMASFVGKSSLRTGADPANGVVEKESDRNRPTIMVIDVNRLPSVAAAMASGGSMPFPDVAMRGERRATFNILAPKRVLPADHRGAIIDVIFGLAAIPMWMALVTRIYTYGKVGRVVGLAAAVLPMYKAIEPAHRLAVSEIDRERWATKTHVNPT